MENLRVFCKAHNHHAAEQVFGRAHVEARIRSARKRASRKLGRKAPPAGTADFSQRQCEEARAVIATAPASAIILEQPRDVERRNHVHAALRTLGFRGAEADRALLLIDREECEAPWRRTIELLLREALGHLT